LSSSAFLAGIGSRVLQLGRVVVRFEVQVQTEAVSLCVVDRRYGRESRVVAVVPAESVDGVVMDDPHPLHRLDYALATKNGDRRQGRPVLQQRVLFARTCELVPLAVTLGACALGRQTARRDFSLLDTRALLTEDELYEANGDGNFARGLAQLAKPDPLDIGWRCLRPRRAPYA
jgi:hypothetical protein